MLRRAAMTDLRLDAADGESIAASRAYVRQLPSLLRTRHTAQKGVAMASTMQEALDAALVTTHSAASCLLRERCPIHADRWAKIVARRPELASVQPAVRKPARVRNHKHNSAGHSHYCSCCCCNQGAAPTIAEEARRRRYLDGL